MVARGDLVQVAGEGHPVAQRLSLAADDASVHPF